MTKRRQCNLAFRKCLKTMAIYLRDHLPVNNVILQDLQCLHPEFRKAEGGRAAVDRLCQRMRKVTKTDQLCDTVCSEWLLYASDSALDSKLWSSVTTCAYWVHVSNMVDTVGEKKYQHVSFVAKAALTLSHSNSSPDPNVGFRWTMLWWWQIGDHCQKEVLSLSVLWRKLSVCLVLALKFQ